MSFSSALMCRRAVLLVLLCLFIYTKLDRTKFKFFNWDASIPTAKQGRFKSHTDPHGLETAASYDASDRISWFVQVTTRTRGYYYDNFTTGDMTRLHRLPTTWGR